MKNVVISFVGGTMKILFIFIYLLMFPLSVLAYQNEPTGFRGLEWGNTLEEISNKQPTYFFVEFNRPKENIVNYDVYIDDNKLSDVTFVNPVSMFFYNGRLSSILIEFNHNEHYQDVLDKYKDLSPKLLSFFGTPQTSTEKNDNLMSYRVFQVWAGNITTIALDLEIGRQFTQEKYNGNLYLNLFSTAINKEITASDAERLAQTAKKGW